MFLTKIYFVGDTFIQNGTKIKKEKFWNCVLDKQEIFLEKRSVQTLHLNAQIEAFRLVQEGSEGTNHDESNKE